MQSFFARYHNMDRVLANIDPLIKQTKLVLKIYREVQWALAEHQYDLHAQVASAGWNSYDTGMVYLTIFAPEIDMALFEEQVCRLVESKSILAFIATCVQRLKRFPEFGPIYYEIINLQFLAHRSLGELEMVSRLNMERSTFYRRKKEALFLLGLCLFGLTPKDDTPAAVEQLSLFTAC